MSGLASSSWQRVVVFAVHPDDESLSAGGLIQHAVARGGDVRVVFITDGDNNPWPQRFVERRWHIDADARRRWGQRRRGEAVAALACLGLPQEKVTFWHYPDQGLAKILSTGGEELIARISSALCQRQPTLLVAPSTRDLHPDHNSFAVLLHFALARADLPRAPSLLEYLIHSRSAAVPAGSFQIALTPEQVAHKRQAIFCHTTQMALSHRRFLAFAKDSEPFLTTGSAGTFDVTEPVLAAEIADGRLCLKLRRLTRPATLLLAAETAAGPLRYSVELSSGLGYLVFNETSGEFLTQARTVRGGVDDELFLPAGLFSQVKDLVVKVVAGRGFYDSNGWSLVPLRPAAFLAATEVDCPGARPRICCVVPCYNLARVCGPIVRAAAGLADRVIAVNDGSDDETERVLREIEEESDGTVEVLSFSRNHGKGIALLEAFRRALSSSPFDILVTLDGDGQHRPEDIPRLARSMVEGNFALVIGERLARTEMPLRSRFGNSVTAAVMKLFHPSAPTDTQSGYRALRRDLVQEIVATIEGGRYETELKILLLALRRGRRVGSVTIPTVYLEGNRLSHFRPIIDSWRIYSAFFRWQLNPSADREVKTPLAVER